MRRKRGKPSVVRNYRFLIGFVGLAIIIATIVLTLQKDLAPLPEEPEDRALAIAQRDPHVADFLSSHPTATYAVAALSPEAAKEKAEKYPAVYGELPEKTLYEVQYAVVESGVFLIIDVENGKVLKLFQTAHQFI
ncbi:MAG: hypothetical protein QXD77_01010 [Candidatus Aenigmatarchaeota archaeon]